MGGGFLPRRLISLAHDRSLRPSSLGVFDYALTSLNPPPPVCVFQFPFFQHLRCFPTIVEDHPLYTSPHGLQTELARYVLASGCTAWLLRNCPRIGCSSPLSISPQPTLPILSNRASLSHAAGGRLPEEEIGLIQGAIDLPHWRSISLWHPVPVLAWPTFTAFLASQASASVSLKIELECNFVRAA